MCTSPVFVHLQPWQVSMTSSREKYLQFHVATMVDFLKLCTGAAVWYWQWSTTKTAARLCCLCSLNYTNDDSSPIPKIAFKNVLNQLLELQQLRQFWNLPEIAALGILQCHWNTVLQTELDHLNGPSRKHVSSLELCRHGRRQVALQSQRWFPHNGLLRLRTHNTPFP